MPQPEDNAGYDMRSMMKLHAVTVQIEDILRRFGPGTSDDIAIAAKLSRDIFGIDVRSSEAHRISESAVIEMIPRAEGCLMTLRALENVGYINANRDMNFIQKFIEDVRDIIVKIRG